MFNTGSMHWTHALDAWSGQQVFRKSSGGVCNGDCFRHENRAAKARRGRAGGGYTMYGMVFNALEWAFPMNAYPIKPTPISGVELKSTVHGDRLAHS